ncbi:PepSY-associated TM helix domain-containing protein [Acinetobacter larvae]|uniref:Peptidase n=1 Tax=Acinetobacter larvae TaxID=1789224 RepID=A0A1B2LZK6_9GAMM|nr:PepSY-associated TM helix domain-containing protein [Acinetobacter larvae]AOA58374.1 hypothetical protein BFG52_08415 [Acinetobacter larvae]
MRVDAKKEGPRQSMSWLHTWMSLLLGWLLYAIFLTGTLSFFQNEITIWMKPELHQSLTYQSQQQQLATALHRLQENSPHAAGWSINLPTARQTTTSISVQQADEQQGQRGGGGRRGGQNYDTVTGEEIKARDTRGGGFLYRFHFELYGMERNTARWLVGLATLFMFVAIISGIITHKKIFKDFFTFRPGKGQRSWLDAHNATAVFALPFHLMITFSGLLLLMFTIMPWGVDQVFEGGRREFLQAQNSNTVTPDRQQNRDTGAARQSLNRDEGRMARSTAAGEGATGREGHAGNPAFAHTEGQRMGGPTKRDGQTMHAEQLDTKSAAPVPMADIIAMLSYAQQQWAGKNVVSSVIVTAPNSANAQVEIRAVASESLVQRDQTPSFKFNAVSGALIATDQKNSPSTVPAAIYNLTTWLHQARGVSLALRWLLFLSGILGTLMIATGLVLWVVKRQVDVQKRGYKPWGHRLVEILNVSSIVGLPIACAVYFWANRVIPAQMEGRSEWEIKCFFIAWCLSLIHAAIRPHRQAWLEQLALASVLFLLIPILNPLTGGRGLWGSLYYGQWVVANFDLACVLLGLVLLYAFYKLKRYPKTPIRAKKVTSKTQAASTTTGDL